MTGRGVPPDRSVTGKTCLITGATSGIGRAAAIALARRGADLILVGRSVKGGTDLAGRLERTGGSAEAHFLRGDLSDQRQVRELAAAVRQKVQRLDVLINNAGARFNEYHASADGIELTFATNHLGHFLLTALLLDLLMAAPNARVVNVSSGSHAGARADGEWCLRPETYDRKQAYSKSKLASILFTYELARKLSGTGVCVNAMDPGGVATNLGRNNGLVSWLKHLGYHALKRELVMPAKGAETVIFLASDSSVAEVTGKYFRKRQEVSSSAASYSEELAEGLWRLSIKLVGLEEPVIPDCAGSRPAT